MASSNLTVVVARKRPTSISLRVITSLDILDNGINSEQSVLKKTWITRILWQSLNSLWGIAANSVLITNSYKVSVISKRLKLNSQAG